MRADSFSVFVMVDAGLIVGFMVRHSSQLVVDQCLPVSWPHHADESVAAPCALVAKLTEFVIPADLVHLDDDFFSFHVRLHSPLECGRLKLSRIERYVNIENARIF
jgi:hypothetical protein